MISDKQRAEIDQSLALMQEIFPVQWWGLYSGLLKQGFEPHTALSLVQTYISAACKSS